MGFIDDMKKLLWAKKAVAKSAAKKGAKEFQDITSEGYDRVKDFTDDVTDKAEDAFDKAKDYVSSKTESSSWEKPEEDFVPSSGSDSETVAPISDTMKKAAQAGSKKFEQAKKAGSEAFDQAKKTGGEVLDKAVDMSDKVWEKAEEIGEKVAEADIPGKAKDLVDKVTEKVNTKMDDMLKKAEELDETIEEERKAMDADDDGYADIPTHQKLRDQGSLIDDKDDFWSKADSFAAGDYSMGKARVVGTDDTMNEDTDDGPLKGFADNDGDGDPLMDDAIIVEDPDDSSGSDEGDDKLNLLPLSDDESE